jgi:hypothetical protein
MMMHAHRHRGPRSEASSLSESPLTTIPAIRSFICSLFDESRVAALTHIGTTRRGHHDYVWSDADASSSDRFEVVDNESDDYHPFR